MLRRLTGEGELFTDNAGEAPWRERVLDALAKISWLGVTAVRRARPRR